MSTIVAMTSTVGELTNGQSYRVRSKTAELLVAQSKATKTVLRRISSDKEGKG